MITGFYKPLAEGSHHEEGDSQEAAKDEIVYLIKRNSKNITAH